MGSDLLHVWRGHRLPRPPRKHQPQRDRNQTDGEGNEQDVADTLDQEARERRGTEQPSAARPIGVRPERAEDEREEQPTIEDAYHRTELPLPCPQWPWPLQHETAEKPEDERAAEQIEQGNTGRRPGETPMELGREIVPVRHGPLGEHRVRQQHPGKEDDLPPPTLPVAEADKPHPDDREQYREYQCPHAARPLRSPCHAQEERHPHALGSSRVYPGLSVHDTIAEMERNDADYTIIFDGGSRGNPGEGYGSYELRMPGHWQIERLTFGDNVTNNEAEYRTLIAALHDAINRITAASADPKTRTIAVRGDSQLVIFQVLGTWKVRAPHIRPLHAEATALLARFKRADIRWQPRAMSVRILGH